jgi:UDP-N-acetylmuramoylalanine--D-glutamate ligase
VTVLVEGFAADAVALARLLAQEGRQVRLAGPGPATPAAAALRADGVAVEEQADLDADPGEPEAAFLDVWTPEVAPRVRLLRAAGARLTCLSDLLLERARVSTLGVTGTAGKTTTTAFAVQLLRAAGTEVAASTTARAANLWATEELLAAPAAQVLALELTSSHLCFTTASPEVAVVTSFWPDHVELHGSVAAYRRAKEAIVRGQGPDGWVVVNADDAAAASFADLTPARRAAFSLVRDVEAGAFLRGGDVVARWEGREAVLGGLHELPPMPALRAAALGAAAAALAAGARLDALEGSLRRLELPPHRGGIVARAPRGTAVVDAGLAATPAKAAAVLETYADRSVVLVAGGDPAPAAGSPVHASPEEQALLERACDEAARAASGAIVFGAAAERLEEPFARRGLPVAIEASLEDALARSLASARGDQTVVFAPMYPLDQGLRGAVPDLARRMAGRVRE